MILFGGGGNPPAARAESDDLSYPAELDSLVEDSPDASGSDGGKRRAATHDDGSD
jgi:hypothetical protein